VTKSVTGIGAIRCSRWAEYIDRAMADVATATPAWLAHQLITFAGVADGASPNKAVRQILKSLGLPVGSDGCAVPRGHGLLRAGDQAQRALWPGNQVIELGNMSPERKAYLTAHEIGHHVLESVRASPAAPPQFKLLVDSAAEEIFCIQFATCLVLERTVWRTLDQVALERIVTERGCMPEPGHSFGAPKLSFLRLRALAAHFGISIRMAVAGLAYHALLDELSAGVVVVRLVPYRNTLANVALRVWQSATPRGVYVPRNQRASSLGLSHAADVYEADTSGVSVISLEELKLSRKVRIGDVAKWRKTESEVLCEYTPLDVKGEGRFLLVVFDIA
jgi:hypothetical protein